MTSKSTCRSRRSRNNRPPLAGGQPPAGRRLSNARGQRWIVPLLAALLLVVSGVSSRAQVAPATGGATFRILQNGIEIGVTSTAVTPEPEGEAPGWVIRGSSYLGGDYKLTVRRFEAHYDTAWRPRFATMELSTPGDTLVAHTAIKGSFNRTEVVQAGKTAMWGEVETSPDTIVIPDMVFPAYEALAARLTSAEPGTDLPVFVLPLSEIRLRIESVSDDEVMTPKGPLGVQRWVVAFQTTTRMAPAEIWVAEGRLVRVDMRLDGISVIRTDVQP